MSASGDGDCPQWQPNSTTLADASEKKVLTELQIMVARQTLSSIFVVGGSIPITPSLGNGLICETDEAISDTCSTHSDHHLGHNDSESARPGKSASSAIEVDSDAGSPSKRPKLSNEVDTGVHKMRCTPVTLRWESPSGSGNRLILPCSDDERPALEQLLQDCLPASFGRDGKDVFDESYRKAGKLDESNFSTNFSPYALGIIETAGQALLPNAWRRNNETAGLRAELYKLNVYSAPSGMFKAHVDTPRSKHQ
ncbi:hypothetical protein LTR66_015627, partial [Elasticomyces elasticus]